MADWWPGSLAVLAGILVLFTAPGIGLTSASNPTPDNSRVAAESAEASSPGAGTSAAHVCDTRIGRESQVLDLARRRALERGESLALTPSVRSVEAASLDSGLTPRLAALLGENGDIERGAVLPVGDITVVVDDGQSIFGTFLSGLEVDVVRVARQYYNTMPDDVDHLTLLPSFDHDSGTFHLLIRNDVQGINRPLQDDTSLYGSAGRLQSVLLFSNYLRRPQNPAERIGGDSNTTLSLMAHEFGHRFSAFVRFDLDAGPFQDPSTRLLGRGQSHWCFYTNSASMFPVGSKGGANMSALEGNLWIQDSLSGLWSNQGVTDGYSPLDLYLMGLAAPEEVPPVTLLIGQSGLDSTPTLPGGGVTGYGCVSQPLSVPPQRSITIDAVERPVTLDEIIAIEGPRVPDHTVSQKDFRQALVLVARQGLFPRPDEIARLERLRREWEPYYSAATGGRSTVTTTRDTPPGPAQAFAFVRFPDDLQAGRPLSLGLVALDGDGRVASGFTGAVRISSDTDIAAQLPADVVFGESDAGYLLLDEPVVFATGGEHSLTATAIIDGAINGTRSGLQVEDPVVVDCMYLPGAASDPSEKPWGVGATFSGVGGVRFQYLIEAESIGRPGVILNLDWPVEESPDGVQWESMVVQMAHRPTFDLNTRLGEVDLNLNVSESLDATIVAFGPREQIGMKDSGRVHLVLDPPFSYNGIDNLLIDIRYTGGGPPGLMTSEVFAGGRMLTIERLGPNFPVLVNRTANVCLGIRPPSGQPPTLSGLFVDGVRNDTALINWLTSPATDGRVAYGLAGGPLDSISEVQRFGLSHQVRLEGLSTDTEYEAVAISQDYDAQEARSQPLRFRTTRLLPQIFDLSPKALRRNTFSNRVLVAGANLFEGFTAEIVTPDLTGPEPPAPDPDMWVVFSQALSENLADLRVSVRAGAPLGPRRIHLTNRDGFDVYSDVFLGIIPPTEGNDVDNSGRVDGFDLARLARAFGTTYPDERFDALVDLDGSGTIDGVDLTRLANNFGRTFLP